jgi:hypothetical protein
MVKTLEWVGLYEKKYECQKYISKLLSIIA